jgi:aspartate carbamoyltransferase catalytic subunit
MEHTVEHNLSHNSLISLADLTKQDILDILIHAKRFQHGLVKNTLAGRVLASCFFEASTRTRLSFEAAVAYLGGKVIGFADSGATSLGTKGESFADTIRMIAGYADGLILRHPNDGAARLAQELMTKPVINAGDGANQHPSQTLIDLFSIEATQGQLHEINLGLMGDLRYSRTIHSLIAASKLFKMRLFLIAPLELRIATENLFELRRYGISYSFHHDLQEVIPQLDCLYLTRMQKERVVAEVDCTYAINLQILEHAKPNFRILHPLPRLSELPLAIDSTPYAYYLQQAHNGLFVRQALLDLIFG